MLDGDLPETWSVTGSVSLLVPEDGYGTIEVPEAVRHEVVSPRSAFLGVADDVLENTLFTRVKLGTSDFTGIPRRNISLLFVKKDVVEKTPAAIAGLSPVFIILKEDFYGGKRPFIAQTAESAAKISMLLKDHFLLLPLYLAANCTLNSQGVDVALRNFYGGAAGRLWANVFICHDICLFGKSYFGLPNCRHPYLKGRDFSAVWRNWHMFHEIATKLRTEIVDYDIGQIATPDYMKYREEEVQC